MNTTVLTLRIQEVHYSKNLSKQFKMIDSFLKISARDKHVVPGCIDWMMTDF